MPAPRPDVLDFLLTRRSRPAKTLAAPAPDPAELAPLLEAALRVPDHGKLEPWRLIVLRDASLTRLAARVRDRGQALQMDPAAIEKQAEAFARSPLVVAVIASPQASEKIPPVEQLLSAGAVCLSLLNAALAAGWGANWLTGWAAHDRDFASTELGLADPETVAGFVHIGTETAPPPERPRPETAAKILWVDQ